MNDKQISDLNKKLDKLNDTPEKEVEITQEEAKWLGAYEDDSMSMEDALESHDFESTQQGTPSNIKAFSGEKLELPIYYTKPKSVDH